MSDSKKEQILNSLYDKFVAIRAGDRPYETSEYVFENTVALVMRQYLVVTADDIANKSKPWILINNEGEKFGALPSSRFDNNILITVIGFVEASDSSPNLDSMMNSLQKDIIAAILSDRTLNRICTDITIKNIFTVDELIYPHGGFGIDLEINYSFTGLNM